MTPAIYRRVFGTDEGMVVLADLMKFTGLWDVGFEQDERKAERYSGQRDVVLYILDQAGISADYHQITRALMSIPAREPEPKQEVAE